MNREFMWNVLYPGHQFSFTEQPRITDEYTFRFCPDPGCDEGVLIPNQADLDHVMMCEAGHTFPASSGIPPMEEQR